MNDSWQSGNPYDSFMGRWSRLAGRRFLKWLAIPGGRSWLDVGCGTGSLTKLILESQQPADITAIDSSPEFIAYARQTIGQGSVDFKVNLAQSLELDTNSVHVTVSGLVLNFVPQPEEALAEMRRVTKPDGEIGVFLWDYAEGMEMLRVFWDTAVELDKSAKALDEGLRFPLCREGQLERLVRETGLQDVESMVIEIETVFQDFDDYWRPFLGHVGPAPGYVMSLDVKERNRLRDKLQVSLPIAADGSISLKARAWAVKGQP